MEKSSESDLILRAIQQGSFPRYVYKYRDISDRTKNIFKSGEFWFAQPDSFNDPFDCNLSETHEILISDLENFATKVGLSERTFEECKSLMHNNPLQLRNEIIDIKKKAINNFGILSLSANHDDILMWSHYSAHHTGLVICLDMEADPVFFLKPIRIKYSDTYAESNYLKDPNKSSIDNISIKSAHWEYEDEIRIYKKPHGLYSINKQAIVKIYFGAKTSQIDIDDIVNLCNASGCTNVQYFKASLAHSEFKLNFTQI